MYFDAPNTQNNQYDQYGQFAKFTNQQPGPYGATGGEAIRMGKDPAFMGAKMQPRRRLNLVAILMSLFVPWLTFCFILAMLTFNMHYRQASTCKTISIVVGVVFALLCIYALFSLLRRWTSEEAAVREAPSWLLFISVTSIVALVIAIAVGNRNYWINMQPYYDLSALNSYSGVDPARYLGKEIMDAGRVRFVEGTQLDLSRSMGFMNRETYCVAPISGGSVVEGNPPLVNYDFWAVGKDCCTGNIGDFRCGAYDNPNARGGVRVVRDEDRAFYRLAVQQAQSVHSIHATHPLFFHWVEDPVAEVRSFRQEGYKWYLAGMFIHFVFQLLLVGIAICAFANRDTVQCCPSSF